MHADHAMHHFAQQLDGIITRYHGVAWIVLNPKVLRLRDSLQQVDERHFSSARTPGTTSAVLVVILQAERYANSSASGKQALMRCSHTRVLARAKLPAIAGHSAHDQTTPGAQAMGNANHLTLVVHARWRFSALGCVKSGEQQSMALQSPLRESQLNSSMYDSF